MPGTPEHPVTLGDLLVSERFDVPTEEWVYRPATVADLVSALRAEGVLVVERVDGEWAEWALTATTRTGRGMWDIECYELDALALVSGTLEQTVSRRWAEWQSVTCPTHGIDAIRFSDGSLWHEDLAEAQPFPPAGE